MGIFLTFTIRGRPNAYKYFGLALAKYHKTRVESYDSVGLPNFDCSIDCAAIQIKSNQQIVYERELIEEKALQDSLFLFFCNDNNEEIKSQKKIIFDVYGKPQEISIGYVQLEYINDSCSVLQSVIKDIQYSLNSYKNYLSKIWYQKEYIDIGKPEKTHLDSLLENRLILFGRNKEYIVTPPPSPPTHEECRPDSLIEAEAEEL